MIVALTAIHLGTGTRPGDPLVFIFIGGLAVIGAALTYVRARGRALSGGAEAELKMMGSPPLLALIFVLTLAYSYAISQLLINQPGESPTEGIGIGITLGVLFIILNYRRGRDLTDSFLRMLGLAFSVAIAGAGLTWALRRLV